MIRHKLFLSGLSFLAVLLTASCARDSGPATSDVVASIPWFRAESHTYVLKNSDGEILGRQVLTVDVQNGETILVQRFTGENSTDTSTVVVDSMTLKPISSEREIDGSDDDVLIITTYTEAGALIRQDEKQTGLSVPEHSYDNDTSLFLWRALPFEIGYESSYITIITNQRSSQKVRLVVSGRETVIVPAGEFIAWRLEITTSNAHQVAWYADIPGQPLIRYDNSRGLFFELDRAPDTALEP